MSTVSLVLLPGLDGTGMLFRPLLAALPASLPASVVAYPATEPLGYEALLPQVMAALPDNSPFVLLGESFSGPLALLAASQRPAGLVGVVLCASFFRSPHPYLPHRLHGLLRPALFRMVPQISRLKARLGFYATPELGVLVGQALAMVSPEVFACRLRAVLAVDAAAALTECPVPLLYLRGARDWVVVPAWNARATRRVLPSSSIRIIPTGHMVLQTEPQLAAAALVDFAATLAADREL